MSIAKTYSNSQLKNALTQIESYSSSANLKAFIFITGWVNYICFSVDVVIH